MIELRQLSHIYHQNNDRKTVALKNINLSIKKGEHVAILGPNGCGKSTLAKHLNGLLLPTEGQVLIEGIDTYEEDHLFQVREKVGMVFQNPDNQLVATTVLEEVAFGPENIGLPRDVIRERIDEALHSVGMSDFKDAQPHQLSGGQKQRIAIAGVIAMRPDVIVFDEPTAMLDPSGRADVMKTMLSLNHKEHLTIINITHFMEEAVMADRVVVMGNGEIVLDGSPREVFKHFDVLRDLKLDIPLMMELASQLHKRHPDFPEDVLSIDEMVGALCQF